MARELKELLHGEFKRRLGGLDGCVLIDYQGLDSEKTQDLRRHLHKGGVKMNVVQNRLARRVFQEAQAPESFQRLFRGPTAVLVSRDGAIKASKQIVNWRKTNEAVAAIKGGLFRGKTLTPSDVEDLAKIPDEETLRQGVAGLLVGPLGYLVSCAQGLVAHMAGCIKARREMLEKQ